jgi:hypothetical protein
VPDKKECPCFCRDSPPVSAAPTPSADREPARFTEVPLPSALSGKSDMEVRQASDICVKRGVEGRASSLSKLNFMQATVFSKYPGVDVIEVLLCSCHVQVVICVLWAAWRRPEGDASAP